MIDWLELHVNVNVSRSFIALEYGCNMTLNELYLSRGFNKKYTAVLNTLIIISNVDLIIMPLYYEVRATVLLC